MTVIWQLFDKLLTGQLTVIWQSFGSHLTSYVTSHLAVIWHSFGSHLTVTWQSFGSYFTVMIFVKHVITECAVFTAIQKKADCDKVIKMDIYSNARCLQVIMSPFFFLGVDRNLKALYDTYRTVTHAAIAMTCFWYENANVFVSRITSSH